ncbi:hypothetical protein [Amycolatopsis sp. 3B14]|uniref:hypothetical protein n=1 Tax=Amycolatopsis sp. 3B14 TaxID=3243600 RepID=UPI003D96CBF1
MKEIASGPRFPEGRVALDDGSVLVVEIERGTLSRRVWPDGSVTVVADCGGGPTGAAIGPDEWLAHRPEAITASRCPRT